MLVEHTTALPRKTGYNAGTKCDCLRRQEDEKDRDTHPHEQNDHMPGPVGNTKKIKLNRTRPQLNMQM